MAKQKRTTLPKDFSELLAVGEIETLKAVFDRCQVDARGGVFKQTALAFYECPDELTRWLVEQGADLAARDGYGETPLHSRAGHWNGRVELLIALGADVNDAAEGQGTPLHRAAATGNLGAAQALLVHGARADATNRNGQTPLVFALHRCSNATIAQMAPMAELLLAALRKPPAQSPPFLRRIFGGSSLHSSPVTSEMRNLVQRIGSDFEFNRSGFNPESRDEASDALDRLYAAFDVAPIPHRDMHDGESPILASPGRWQDQHQQLWELLVPSSGSATTVQGELIRISGRIADEIERNGGGNWDGEYRAMADAFLAHLGSGQPLPSPELDEARKLIGDVKRLRGDPEDLCRLAVRWVELNPQAIALSGVAYSR